MNWLTNVKELPVNFQELRDVGHPPFPCHLRGPHYLAFQDKPDTLAVHGIELVAHGDRKQKVGSHKTLENERRFRRQLLPSRFLCLVTHLPCHVIPLEIPGFLVRLLVSTASDQRSGGPSLAVTRSPRIQESPT